MKRLLLINSVLGYGSTGRIVLDIAKEYEDDGYEVKIAYGRKDKIVSSIESDVIKYGIRIGNQVDVYSHVIYTRLTDKHGLASKKATQKFIKWAKEFDPDILWLHNIHGYYLNYEELFSWIKTRPNMKIKWTLHDCWAFTGHCSHFTYVNCEKWGNGCSNCPQSKQYPKSIRDASEENYRRKKDAFARVNNLTIVTPSKWLKDLVKKSFLSEYNVEVVYNKIDTDIFRPTQSAFKEEHGFQDKKIILGVSNVWNDRKGLNCFLELSEKLDASKCKIVLVGLSSYQIKEIRNNKSNILGLPRTDSVKGLAEIYSAADIFVNPSYEETFGLTTAEAQACGTYTIVYKGTACEEIMDKNNGCAAKDLDEIFLLIQDRLGK